MKILISAIIIMCNIALWTAWAITPTSEFSSFSIEDDPGYGKVLQFGLVVDPGPLYELQASCDLESWHTVWITDESILVRFNLDHDWGCPEGKVYFRMVESLFEPG